PLAEGELTETLRVETDADEGSALPVTVRGQGGPTPIGLDPKQLDFETLEVDSERTLSVTVHNPVDLPLTLTVQGAHADPFTTDMMTLPPHGTQVVNTRYFPRELGPMGARLEVRACDTCTPSRVELSGNSVPSAFAFDPAPVPFAPNPVHEHTQSLTRA